MAIPLASLGQPSVRSRQALLAWVALSSIWGVSLARGADAVPDFTRDVRPILSHNCFACHGPDEHDRRGGLRLDDRTAAIAELDSGMRAIVPGRPDESELVARIHAVVRRSKGHAQSVIKTGDVVVNLDAKTVEVGGLRVHLTGKEYQMFELLSLRKGTTLTKEMFLNHLYGGMDEPELKIIDVFICKLRKKLAQSTGGDHFIETVWGRGYVLRDPDPRVSAALAEKAA
jgi:DNA-binding winged helix-turn-helix (wHTH) protein